MRKTHDTVPRESAAISRRRRELEPEHVLVLLVGESAPSGGTHYYKANSILFSAVREAAVRVYGRHVPEGEQFLSFARDHGVWLVDLAARPVNKLDAETRRTLVWQGVPRIARLIAACSPPVVVAIGSTHVASPAAGALQRSGVDAELVILRFPVRQWRDGFVAGLARVLRLTRPK